MSYAQQQIIDKAVNLSEADAVMVANLMDRLIALYTPEQKSNGNKKMEAYQRLNKLTGGFPEDFDPDRELAEAREEKYGFKSYRRHRV